jgi:hypothetical protein
MSAPKKPPIPAIVESAGYQKPFRPGAGDFTFGGAAIATGKTDGVYAGSAIANGKSPPATTKFPEKPVVKPSPVPTPETTQPVPDFTVKPLDPATSEALLEAVRDQSAFLPNLLEKFDNKAWSVKLFMTPDQVVLTVKYNSAKPPFSSPKTVDEYYAEIDKFEQVIIAESGITTFNITGLDIEQNVAPHFKNSGLNTTAITMTVNEPNGVRFLDSIKEAGLKLAVRDFRKCWMYIELTFKGYEDGIATSNLLKDQKLGNSGRWIWQVVATNINTKISAAGGEYKISFVPHNEMAYDPEARCLPDTITCEGDTVKEIFDDLAHHINDSWVLRTGSNLHYKVDFVFHGVKGHPEVTGQMIEQFSVKPIDQQTSASHQLNMTAPATPPATPSTDSAKKVDGTPTVEKTPEPRPLSTSPTSNKQQGQFVRGTSIDEIVHAVFSCSDQAQKLAKGHNGGPNDVDFISAGGKSDGKTTEQGFRESIVFRVEPEIRILFYDVLFNTYGKSITYHIYGYTTQTPILSQTQVLNANDPETQKKMLASIVKQNLLKKRYDYIYTGLNSSVLNFDATFDYLWAATIPRTLRTEALVAQARLDPKVLKDYKDSQALIQAIYEEQSVIDSAHKAFNDAQASGDATAAAAAQKDLAPAEATLDAAKQELGKLRLRLQAALPELTAEAEFNSARYYVEDLSPQTSAPLNDMRVMLQYTNDEARHDMASGMVGASDQGRAIYGTILNQLEGSMTSQLMNITLEITGDPYWIGPSNMEQVVLRNNDIDVTGVADYTIGDNTMVIIFKYPLGTNDDGSPKLEENEVFTGLYRVTKVQNNFNESGFKQTLDAIRMPLIDLVKASARTDAKK